MAFVAAPQLVIPPTDGLAARSPEWWVRRLNATLDERRDALALNEAYYCGNHPLPIAPDKAKDAFRRLLKQSRSNWMGLVVDAVNERLAVEGFRYGSDGSADKQAWKIWQANGLDVGSQFVHIEALKHGESFVLVEPNPENPRLPLIHPEHPTQVVVACDAGRPRRRRAAFKKWLDESGYVYATLYLPEEIYKLRSQVVRKSGERQPILWVRREIAGEDFPLANPLGEPPIVPFWNKPKMLGGGVSELEGLTDIQDRINKTLFDRLMAAEFSAFRQKWGTGIEIPTDPETDQPIEPYKSAVDRLWLHENPEARFGEFSETNLAGYISSVEADIQHLAAISRTPPHYLLGQSGAFPSGESLKSTETGLVAKASQRAVVFGEGWEEVMRLAFKIIGSPKAKVTDAETIWRNPESRTLGELTDSLLKMRSLGAPQEALWVDYGLSPQKIAQWKAWAAEEAINGPLGPPPAEAPVSGATPAN